MYNLPKDKFRDTRFKLKLNFDGPAENFYNKKDIRL